MSSCKRCPSACEESANVKRVQCGPTACQFAADSELCCAFPDGFVIPAQYDEEQQIFFCILDMGDVAADSVCGESAVVKAGDELVCEGKACCKICSKAPLEVEAPRENAEEEKSDEGIGGKLSFLDTFLYVWIFLAMLAGVLVSEFAPEVKDAFNVAKIDNVSITIAVGLWAMMYPVLCKVKYEILPSIFRNRHVWRQLGFSLIVNWVVGPLLMTGLAWATLPDLDGYRNGVILVGIARCIAMVLIWNQLARGDSEYCAILVAVNSVMQMVLFAPLALFYLQVVSRQYLDDDSFCISFWTVCKNVLLYLGAPLALAIITRVIFLLTTGAEFFDKKIMPWVGPLALIGLLYTVFVLFVMQGSNVIDNIGDVFRTAVPLLLYFAIMWTGTFFLARKLGFPYPFVVTQAFTAASNNFELAIAVAVGTFGIESQEALAATVGPLIEVPALLALVYVALWLRRKVFAQNKRFVLLEGEGVQGKVDGQEEGAVEKAPEVVCGGCPTGQIAAAMMKAAEK